MIAEFVREIDAVKAAWTKQSLYVHHDNVVRLSNSVPFKLYFLQFIDQLKDLSSSILSPALYPSNTIILASCKWRKERAILILCCVLNNQG